MLWATSENVRIPIKSWCADVEPEAMIQAQNLANHPALYGHVALMPDCHCGYGMPIGGVVGAKNAVLPSAVGVDIGCGMVAVETDIPVERMKEMRFRREIQNTLKKVIPVGDGVSHKKEQEWEGFEKYLDSVGAVAEFVTKLDRQNLGTLGGGNHFIELQQSDAGYVWMMIHSGSRNLGKRIHDVYHAKALELCTRFYSPIRDPQLAFLPLEETAGQAYLRDMNFALDYARENRRRMMEKFKETLAGFVPETKFIQEVNIYHNYATLEDHYGEGLYIHRKGATSAKKNEIGIIPGSMGTASYIVRGLGNPQSFQSCSHGAGRKMSRSEASKVLTVPECDAAMEGIVCERWSRLRHGKLKGMVDLSEAPQAYKDIEDVISSELDLIEPLVRLTPLAVLKG